MKYILITIALLWSSIGHSLDLSQRDKKMHMFATGCVSAAVTTVMVSKGYSKTTSFLTGMLFANFIGYAKEKTDSRFDPEDIQANVIGSVIGAGITVSIDF